MIEPRHNSGGSHSRDSVDRASLQWKRVCELVALLQDAPPEAHDSILTRECGDDLELRQRALVISQNYSENDELFGVPLGSPLLTPDPLAGQRIGPWQILRLLGEGGMGRVYLVKRDDEVFSQFAALKINRESSHPDSIRRFQAERRILAMLEHPSIARAIDGGTTPSGAPYLVMEYVENGCPIDEFRPESPVRDKVALFLQVVEAVKVAHRHQIAHRDLKPSNIFVTLDGLPKVLDFGIAKLFEAEAPTQEPTQAGQTALTPTYASPEQLLREPSSLSSDIYSLGAVLYKILTSRPPHDLSGLNLLDSVRLVTDSDVPRPSTYNREISPDLDAILLKALARSPAQRYATVAEFAEDLRCYLDGVPVKARDGAYRNNVRRFIRSHRALVAIAVASLAGLAVWGAKAFNERQITLQRLEQVRTTAPPVIAEYESQLAKFTGSTTLRNQIANDEKNYLDSVFTDASQDRQLQRLLATAYGSLATHQVEKVEAQQSLRRSLSLWRDISKLSATDADRLATATAARRLGWSQISTAKLTEADASLKEGLALIDAMRDASTAARAERVKLYFELSRLGAWGGKGPAAIDYARKAVAEHEKLPPQPIDRGAIVLTRMQLADVADTYGSGDPKLLAEALHQTRLAVRAVRERPNCEERSCRDVKAAVLTRAPIIFMHQDLIQEALALRDGVDLAEDLLAEDPGNTSATASLRFGLLYLGWLLNEVGRLEDSLRARRRLLEISAVLPGSVSSPEERLKEAIACIEVGRTLVALKRLQEAHGYFDRGAEILANPPTENIYWFMRQTDVFQDLGLLHEKMGRPAAARTEFAKASAAAAKFLEKAKSSLAKEIEARSHYLEGKALLAVDKPRGCELLGKSVNRIAELKANGPPNKYWDETAQSATQAMRPCRVP